MRIVVAMSGGVDSSVAAALLAREGHEVIGLSMQLYDHSLSSGAEEQSARTGEGGVRFGTCCTIDDLHDARRVAARIGIPHYIVNFEEQFAETVIANFVSEYAAGRTPIPCVHCNGDLKFATLAARAEGLGADFVATGHYARVDLDPATGRYRLEARRGPGEGSVVLPVHARPGAAVARDVPDWRPRQGGRPRAGARARADASRRSRTATRSASSPTATTPRFSSARDTWPARASFAISRGTSSGSTRGSTASPSDSGRGSGSPPPSLSTSSASTPGRTRSPSARKRRSSGGTLTASGVNWIAGVPPVAGTRVTARIRHRHREAAASLDPIGADRVRVTFDEPQTAVAPGQAVVLYDGEVVVGGGWIDSSS